MTDSTIGPPEGAGTAGARLWHAVLDEHELAEHELALLREAVRTVDQLDALAEVLNEEGVMTGAKVHPALVESRQLRLTLARLLGALRVPDEADVRPQRRTGVRQPYKLVKGGEGA
jgi:hypothetical protein